MIFQEFQEFANKMRFGHAIKMRKIGAIFALSHVDQKTIKIGLIVNKKYTKS